MLGAGRPGDVRGRVDPKARCPLLPAHLDDNSGVTRLQADIVTRFRAAWEAKGIEALIGLLDSDATATADGAGLAVTHPRPLVGGERIARAYAEIARPAGDRIRRIWAVRNPEKLRPWRAGGPGRTDGSADSESAAGRETGR